MVRIFDTGDVIPLTVEIRDANGALANAGAVTLTIGLPDGTSISPSPNNPSVGRYQLDYAAVQVGRHSVRWVATGTNASAYGDVFDVRPADLGLIVSLADVKTHLNIPASSTDDDEQIRAFIEAATELVENFRNEVVVRRSITEYHTPKWSYRLVLHSSPVISLTSVARVDGSLSWDVTKLNVATQTGVVSIPGADSFLGMPAGIGGFWGYLKVIYVAGYQVIPPNFTLAAKYIVQHLWESQQQPGLGPPGRFGSDTGADYGQFGSGYALPNRAAELLAGKAPGFA